MAETNEALVVLSGETESSLRTVGHISYALHAIVAVGAVLPGAQGSVLLLLVAQATQSSGAPPRVARMRRTALNDCFRCVSKQRQSRIWIGTGTGASSRTSPSGQECRQEPRLGSRRRMV